MYNLPRELWNIIYHYSDFKTLTNLMINKQHYNELNDIRFWTTYSKDLLIEQVEYNTGKEWIQELYFINHINRFYNQLANSSIYKCQYVVKRGSRKGSVCNVFHCDHQQQEGIINKGKVMFHIKHVNSNKVNYLKNKTLQSYNVVIYGSRYVSIEKDYDQVSFGQLSKEDLILLLYQLFKYKID